MSKRPTFLAVTSWALFRQSQAICLGPFPRKSKSVTVTSQLIPRSFMSVGDFFATDGTPKGAQMVPKPVSDPQPAPSFELTEL